MNKDYIFRLRTIKKITILIDKLNDARLILCKFVIVINNRGGRDTSLWNETRTIDKIQRNRIVEIFSIAVIECCC